MLCKGSNKGFDDTIVYTFYCHSEKFKIPGKPTYEELKQRNKETELNAKEPEALHKGNENILFIDDEESLLKMVKRILEHFGYQVETKTNPAEALEMFRSGPDRFDLVITDMTMPQMTGQRLAKEILDICPDMPIILCTGFREKISEETAGELGIKALVFKPFAVRDFSITVRNVLDKQSI
jgi:CheY-like chemotaxis protein